MELAMNTRSFPRISRRRATWIVAALSLFGLPAIAAPREDIPTLQVGVRSVQGGYEIDGVVEPVKQSVLAAQTSGRVVRLLVKMGDPVKAGQVLATIDDREAVVGVQRSDAQMTQAEAELRNARISAERARSLRAQGFVSQAAVDSAETQLQAAQAAHSAASAGQRASALGQDYTRVTAPYDGWVLQTHVNAGDLAVPGTPVVTVYAPQPLRATVQIPASLAESARASKDVQVQLTPRTDGSSHWVSPVSRSHMPAADPVSQTVVWRLDLAKADSAGLIPGQQLRVRFAGTAISRMVVPMSAVLQRGELTAVYVATAQGFVLRAVRLGANYGEAGVEIAAGLHGGERVALEPVRAGLLSAVASR
jgi:RND family efflux transporter MFP subunit